MSKVFFALSSGAFAQNWSNTGLITADNDWSGVPSIVGYRGDNITAATGVDPRTLTNDLASTPITDANPNNPVQVYANQTNPNTLTSGGVAEFQITDPVVALQGSGTADAPNLVIYLDSTGRQDVHFTANLRDVDGSADNSMQSIAVQYRVGDTGTWTNVAYVADASSGPSLATLVTPIDVVLPTDANNQPQLEIRILTTNATGNDEWIGVDDITVSSALFVSTDTTAPTLSMSTPAQNATAVSVSSNLVFTFSESVKAGTGAITLTDNAGDTRTISVTDTSQITFSGATVTVNPTADLKPGDTYHLSVASGVITDVSGNAYAGTPAPIDFSTTNPTVVLSIPTIQGAATTSPYAGQMVTTQGVVTAVNTTGSRGYYIQDQSTTGPAGASHGVFVFTNAAPGVAVGDTVQVSGTVNEYNAGNTNNRPVTEIDSPITTVLNHTGVPVAVVIGAGGLTPPTEAISGPAGAAYNPALYGVDFYESLEGQLVTVKNAQAVDTTYSNSTWVVADLGAAATGINSRGGLTIGANDFNPERIQVFCSAINAVMGQHLGDITGVLTYFNGEYELIPTQPVTAQATTGPGRETTTLAGDATHVTVAAYNVENLGPVQPGVAQATVDARFAQLGRDIAQNLGSPDILGLEEIQDADGQGTGANLSGAATLQKLIAAIAAAGGPTYSYVEIAPTAAGSTGGAPGGNIRNAYLYNAARVAYVAGSAQLLPDPNLADGDAFNNSRMPLVAKFVFNGQTITAIDVHNYARSGSEELFGVDQPPANSGDQRRVDQTAAVKAYVAQLLASDPNAKITVQGDFNGFQFEPTLTQLTPAGGGQLQNLTDLLAATDRYSTTFEGLSQQIDNLLVSAGLQPGAQFDIVHLNTGVTAANQASDHDPIVSLLTVAAAVTAQSAVTTTSAQQATTDKAAVAPFGGFTITGVTPTTAETVTVTLSAAGDGALAGGGFTQTTPGVYRAMFASAAAAQAGLRALTFTPTANKAAPGSTVTTTFTVQVSDGATSASATDMVTTTSVNDAPALSGLPTGVAASVNGSVTLAPALTLTDPDLSPSAMSARVAITQGFTAGDQLTVTAAAGITASYNAATGVLTLTGAASDADYQAVLRTVAFLETGGVTAGTRTVGFTVTDSGGLASPTVSEQVTVGAAGGGGGFGGGGGATLPNLDAQQAFPTQTANLMRTAVNDPALSDPTSPIFVQAQAEKTIAAQLNAGQISLPDAQSALYHLVDGTTSVAEISYAFFTGKTPTAAGLNYLVHSTANATDLNDAYYAKFSTENRYINFAVALGKGGDGTGAFHAAYDSLSLADATAKAYQAVFGVTADAAKVAAILNALVPDGLGGTETRAQYFAQYGGDGPNGVGTKSAVIGFLLADSVKEGFGAYQQADLHFLQDLAHGTAIYNVDLLAAYAQTPTLVGVAAPEAGLGG